MNTTIKILMIATCLATLNACGRSNNSDAKKPYAHKKKSVELLGTVLTKEKQDVLTPSQVIQALKKGNQRFMNNDLTARDYSKQASSSSNGQYPEAIVLSCIDSRVPVEYIFDKGIGDVFVARVAGNIVNEDILASMEYSCKVSGSKLIVVMGHERCGAIKATIDDVKLGNITALLQKIKPAIEAITYEGEKTSKNLEFVDLVCKSNINNTIEKIRLKSPLLKKMENEGEIKILGAVYNLTNGQVNWL